MTEPKVSGLKHGQSEQRTYAACYSSPKAMCYWLVISIVSWAVLGFIGLYRHSLRAPGAPTILLAVAIGCFANWIRNRTFHCGITGPLFLVVALVLLLSETRIIQIGNAFMWPTVLVGSAIAYGCFPTTGKPPNPCVVGGVALGITSLAMPEAGWIPNAIVTTAGIGVTVACQ